MENKDKIDDLFSKAFQGFESSPPDSVWDNIRTGISTDKSVKNTSKAANGRGKYFFFLYSVIIFLIGGTLYLLDKYSFNTIYIKVVNPLNVELKDIKNNHKDISDNTINYGKSNINTTSKNNSHSNKFSKIKNNQNNTIQYIIKSNAPVISENTNPFENISNLINKTDDTFKDGYFLGKLPSNHVKLPDNLLILLNKKYVLTNLFISDFIEKNKAGNSGILKNRFLMEAGYIPEWIYNSSEITKNVKFIHSLQLAFNYKLHSNWYLQTGIGFSLFNDKIPANIKYLSNDSIGSYQDVDSVDFVFNEGKIAPVFYTSTVTVLDSVAHASKIKLHYDYRYFQVPLIIKYYIPKNNWLITANAGAILNFTLRKDHANLPVGYENVSIKEMKTENPAEIDFKWKLTGGFGAWYKISSNYYIGVEPCINYYLYSLYDEIPNKRPVSFGLKFGLLYKY